MIAQTELALFCHQFSKLEAQIRDLKTRTTGSVFHHDVDTLVETFDYANSKLADVVAAMPPPASDSPVPVVPPPVEPDQAPQEGINAAAPEPQPPTEEGGTPTEDNSPSVP